MSSTSNFTYAQDHAAGHHSRHRTQRDILHSWLTRPVAPIESKPLAWDDLANWRGKTVWGQVDSKRQQVSIISHAPEGKEGERWYVMPVRGGRFYQVSVSKSALELTNPYALAIRPQAAIVVYQGVQI